MTSVKACDDKRQGMRWQASCDDKLQSVMTGIAQSTHLELKFQDRQTFQSSVYQSCTSCKHAERQDMQDSALARHRLYTARVQKPGDDGVNGSILVGLRRVHGMAFELEVVEPARYSRRDHFADHLIFRSLLQCRWYN